MAVFASEIARGGIDAEVFMTRNHVIHRFEFDGIDLKTARSSINQTPEFTRSVFPDPAETPSSLRDETLSKTEITPYQITFTFFEKQGLSIKTFRERGVRFSGLGKG
jgi:hypothetical protein